MRVGSVELVALTDAVGVLGELVELYPGTTASDWLPYRELYPALFAGTSWRLPCACYLVRSGGTTLLVDTGVGPPGLWNWLPEREDGLLGALAGQGVERADVDIVLMTHVHVDHVGWNTDASGEVVFPRARFALHREALAAARERADRPHILRCVLSLEERGLLDPFEGETRLAPGVVAVPLAGHDRGHAGVRIESEGTGALLIADAAGQPALLDRPEWRFESDLDHEHSVATRRALIAQVLDRDVLVACGHYPGGGIGRVVTRDGRVVWEQAM